MVNTPKPDTLLGPSITLCAHTALYKATPFFTIFVKRLRRRNDFFRILSLVFFTFCVYTCRWRCTDGPCRPPLTQVTLTRPLPERDAQMGPEDPPYAGDPNPSLTGTTIVRAMAWSSPKPKSYSDRVVKHIDNIGLSFMACKIFKSVTCKRLKILLAPGIFNKV